MLGRVEERQVPHLRERDELTEARCLQRLPRIDAEAVIAEDLSDIFETSEDPSFELWREVDVGGLS
jgi:hypothetical protein